MPADNAGPQATVEERLTLDSRSAGGGGVARTADKRAGIYRSGGGRDYATHVLAGEIGHNLAGAEDAAEKHVLAWLATHAPLA